MPLMRGRELKPRKMPEAGEYKQDAPYAGARIETLVYTPLITSSADAPYAGARIETCPPSFSSEICDTMPLMRGRELKLSARTAY